MFLDMLYNVNLVPPTVKDVLQLIDFVQTLGYYKVPEGAIAYQCTVRMIDELCDYLKNKVPTLTTVEQVDLAIALTMIPLEPVIDVVNECLADVTLLQFKASCFDLMTSTSDLVDKPIHFIEEGKLTIGLLGRYLVGSKQNLTVGTVGDQIRRLTKSIMASRYELENCDETKDVTWNKLELTTCGAEGRSGPSLEECIKAYDTEWVRDKTLFDVSSEYRVGIQNVTIPRAGRYRITARGAGNKTNTGSGSVFRTLD